MLARTIAFTVVNVGLTMILGTAIAHLLANGRPMTKPEADVLAEVIIAGLRVPRPA